MIKRTIETNDSGDQTLLTSRPLPRYMPTADKHTLAILRKVFPLHKIYEDFEFFQPSINEAGHDTRQIRQALHTLMSAVHAMERNITTND